MWELHIQEWPYLIFLFDLLSYSLLSSTLQYSLHQVWVSVTFPEPDIRGQRHSSLSWLALNPLVLEFPAPEAQVAKWYTKLKTGQLFSIILNEHEHTEWHICSCYPTANLWLNVLPPSSYAYCERPGKVVDKSCCLYVHVNCALFIQAVIANLHWLDVLAPLTVIWCDWK